MTKKTLVKGLDATNAVMDTEQLLSVQYWRSRYAELFPRFANVTKLADEVAPLDSEFAGGSGWLRVRNIHANRGGLKVTAKLVTLMERLRPDEAKPTAPKSRLSRQKLEKVPARR